MMYRDSILDASPDLLDLATTTSTWLLLVYLDTAEADAVKGCAVCAAAAERYRAALRLRRDLSRAPP